jgi:serine/threonine protein kinase
MAHGLAYTLAIKRVKIELDKQNKTFLKEFKRELSTLLRIRPHPNILSLIGVAQNDNNLYLVTEYCDGGSLFEILHKKRHVPLTWEQRTKMILDIARGMIFLHESNDGIMHRDLKSLK